MNISNKSIKLVLSFARQWGLLFFLSALFSLSIALLLTDRWFNVLGRSYSLKTLFFTAPTVFVLIIWLVWPITRNFLNWIEPKTINFHWREYTALVIALIPILAAVYYGWSSYGRKESLSGIHANFEVEITQITGSDLNASAGEICLLEIKDHNGEKVQAETRSISGLTLTGDWTAETNHCLYFSPGSLPGSLKFSYAGPTDAVFHFLFRESKDAGPVLVRSNGKQVAETNLLAEKEGSSIITAPMLLSRTDMLSWNAIKTAGWFAVLAVLSMFLTLSLRKIPFLGQASTFIKYVESKPWISLILVVIVAGFMFWPRGFFTSPDVAYYLSLAKNLYHGNGYVNPDLSPNIYRGPLLPILISLSYVLFGESFLSAVVMERIFWFLTILICYLLGEELYSYRAGFLAALFILTAGVINEAFIRVWTDGPLTFGILALQLMVWLVFIKQAGIKWYVLMGILMGATYLLKQTVIFIAPLPILTWLLFSHFRTRQNLQKMLAFYVVFAFFYVGWDVYVYLAGGSSGQVAGTIKTGINFLSYISRAFSSISTRQGLVAQEEIPNLSSIMAPLYLLDTFYTRDIVSFFRIAVVFPISSAYSLYQVAVRKSKPDIFLLLGLLLYAPLILVQSIVDMGYRQNLYFYCVVLLLIGAMLDGIFKKLSSKTLSSVLIGTIAVSLIFIQVSGGNYIFPESVPVKNGKTLDYFSNYQEIANWVDKSVDPDIKIMLSSRDSKFLHVLTSGNRPFEIIDTCMGEISFSPATKCTPPYISLWVYKGTTDPNEPRDVFQGISEMSLLSSIREKNIEYVFISPSIYSLYGYLKIHPDFEEVDIIDDIVIFRVIRSAQPISTYSDTGLETCLGEGTPAYLKNLSETDPARFEAKMREHFEPWMGLSHKDIESFVNWQGCQFDVNFPGSYD